MHPTTFFIRPAKGLRIADPVTGEYLPEQGKIMPRSGFWLRRQMDGDVIEDKSPPSAGDATSSPEPSDG
jgi:hypothetical protein